jgi:hypothetical protein
VCVRGGVGAEDGVDLCAEVEAVHERADGGSRGGVDVEERHAQAVMAQVGKGQERQRRERAGAGEEAVERLARGAAAGGVVGGVDEGGAQRGDRIHGAQRNPMSAVRLRRFGVRWRRFISHRFCIAIGRASGISERFVRGHRQCEWLYESGG